MTLLRDAWAERLIAVTWPAVALAANFFWARAATRVLVHLVDRRERGRARVGIPFLHHVQIATPPGREAEARAFYRDLLGLPEVPKPAHLVPRGGCWFALAEGELHLGVEADFRPARKAHPALLVWDHEALRARLEAAGVATREDEPLAGYHRFYADDPFGNRVEFLEQAGS